VREYLSATVIIPAPKTTDVRPINICTFYRKLASVKMFQMISGDADACKCLDKLQYALRSGGMEEIIHKFRIVMEVRPEVDVVLLDAFNAFNAISRMWGMVTIMEKVP
jgi:hypothetical protein